MFVELRLRADVQPDVVVEPPKVTFTKGRSESVTLSIKPGLATDAVVKQAYGGTQGTRRHR